MNGAPTGEDDARTSSAFLVSKPLCCYDDFVNIDEILKKIGDARSPLARQLTMVGLITSVLEERGKPAPILIGGLALAYYSREVYFTSDIDLAYADRDALDEALSSLGFGKKGRYWIHDDLEIAVEAPAGSLVGEEAPVETVELEGGLRCVILGVEDLVIDRLNACKHWKSEIDCEMAEILIARYSEDMDWAYLERKSALPENGTLTELRALKNKRR